MDLDHLCFLPEKCSRVRRDRLRNGASNKKSAARALLE
jgi:hypothetical protein